MASAQVSEAFMDVGELEFEYNYPPHIIQLMVHSCKS